MLTFSYHAKNAAGNEFSGQMQAGSRNEAVAALKRKGLFLLRVDAQSRVAALLRASNQIGGRVTANDKAIFAHQLATLLKAGMKLTTALETLSKQIPNKALKSIVAQIHSDIEQSSSLSEAMSRHPKVFPGVFTAVIEAAEQSGTLAETLGVLSSQLRKQASVTSRIKSAMVYPVFLLVVSAMVVGILMTFVIPKFLELFVDPEHALPLPTRILIRFTEVFSTWWYLALFAIVFIAMSFAAGLRHKKFKNYFDALALKLPIIGTLNLKLQISRFTRTLGALVNGGVGILKSIQTTRGTTGNSAFANDIAMLEQRIVRGSTLAGAMASQKYFPEITINLIAVGEQTGNIAEMLFELADMYDNESESAINAMTTLLGPLMIVFLGGIIGFVVLAILMPIFETSTMVG